MKPRLSSLLALSLLLAYPSQAATYLVDGVTTSGGYYDVHKGYDGKDENMCWAATASNVIQYWQDYYGVFYKGEKPLPNGASSYTGEGAQYGKRYLQVFEEFRNNWENEGGTASSAWSWWFFGFPNSLHKTGDNPGGYFFSDYFKGPWYTVTSSSPWYDITSPSELTPPEFNRSIISAFTKVGSAAYISLGTICPRGNRVGHALTCYGYETDANGNITGLYLCNSDDRKKQLFLCDIKKTKEGYVLLSHGTDEGWSYAGYNDWKIEQISVINTPERLVDMQKTYSSSDLVWNGGSENWVLPETTRGVLPSANSGWEASAGEGEGMFASFFADGRNVVFNGKGSGKVSLQGALAPASVLVDTSTRDYSFSGTGRLTGGDMRLTIQGSGSLTIATSNTYGGGTELLGGSLTVQNSHALGNGDVLLHGGALNLFGGGAMDDLSVGGNFTVEEGRVVFDLSSGGSCDTLSIAGAMDLQEATFQLDWAGEGNLGAGIWALASYESCRIGTIVTQASGFATPGLSVTYRSEGNTLYAVVSDGSIGDLTTLDWKDGAELWTIRDGAFSVATWHQGEAIAISGYETVTIGAEVTPSGTVVDATEAMTMQGSGGIAGTGALVKKGGGNLVIATANSYSGGTRVESGTITLQNARGLGDGDVSISYGKLDLGGLAFGNAVAVRGTAILDNGANFTGALTLENGSLAGNERIRAGSYDVRTGSISLNLGGSDAALTKTGNGRVLLSGDNTFGGGVTVQAGTLAAGSATSFGTGGVLLEGGTLDAAGYDLANAVRVDKGDNFLLNADRYRGELSLHGGTLSLRANGEAKGATSSAASLTMTGGRLELLSGDGVAPALSVAGNVSIAGGSVGMTLALNPASSALLTSGGSWSISGAEILFGVDARYAPSTLTEGKHTFVLVEGDAGTWERNTLAFTETCAKYFGADNVSVYEQDGRLLMDVDAAIKRFYTNRAVFPNLNAPARVGAVLLDDALLRDNPQVKAPDSELARIMNAIDQLADAGRAGEAAPVMAAFAGNSTTALTASLAQSATGQLRSIRNRIPSAMQDFLASEEAESSFWMEADSSLASLSAHGGASGYTNSSWGGTVGCDTLASPNFFLGAAFSAASGKLTANAADPATGHLDTYALSLYAQVRSARWTHTGILIAGVAQADLKRRVSYESGGYEASGDTNGSTLAASYELAWEALRPDEDARSSFAPLASLSLTSIRLRDYTETGADNAGLRVTGLNRTFGTAALGFRSSLPIGSNVFNREAFLSLRMAALQDIGSRRGVSEVSLPGASSQRQKGADIGSTGLEAGLGITVPLEMQSSLYVDVQAEFRAHQSSVQGTVGYRYFF